METKASRTEDAIWMHTRVHPKYTPRRYDQFARVGYEQNPIVYAAVSKIADAVARVPLVLYADSSRKREIEDHPLLDLLHRPNPMESWEDFTRRVIGFRKITGNAFLEQVTMAGQPVELYALRTDRMRIRSPRPGVYVYRYEVHGRQIDYTTDHEKGTRQIWHWKGFHPTDDFWGMGSLDPAAKDVDMFAAYTDHNTAMLQNAATPSGVFRYAPKDGGQTSNGQMPQAMFERLKDMIDKRFRSGKNAGKPLLLEGGLEWEQTAMSHKDMEYIEGQRENARRLALAFGIPPQLLGIPGDSTYSNYQEANRAFYRDTVLPLANDYLSMLARWLGPQFGDREGKLVLTIDEDRVPALAEERAKLFEMMMNADWLTVNEKRAATGFAELKTRPADDEHDQVLVASTKAPLTMKPDGNEAGTGLDAEDDDVPPPKRNGAAGGVKPKQEAGRA
jgi:HK97 family phage portal protein